MRSQTCLRGEKAYLKFIIKVVGINIFEYIDPNCLSKYAKTFNWANHSIYRNIKLHNLTKHTAMINKNTTFRGILFPMHFQCLLGI